MKSVRLIGIVVGLAVCAALSWAKGTTVKAEDVQDKKPLSKTVGIHVVTRTENPDKSLTLLYRWNDRQLDRDLERSVTINADTVIGIHGKLSKLSDVTDEVLRAPSVASVGPDKVTAFLLRVGQEKIKVSKDQLTPKQVANLESIAPKPTAASDAALDKRVAGIVAELNLKDPDKEAKLREILTTQLKAVRETHNAGFTPPPSAREDLNKGLKANLTPEQIDQVKETLTSGVMMRTFGVYHEVVPQLTPEHDKVIMGILLEAREAALDVKNPDQLGGVFSPYKDKIEAYITAQGHDWKQAYRAFVKARNEGKAADAAKSDAAKSATEKPAAEKPAGEQK